MAQWSPVITKVLPGGSAQQIQINNGSGGFGGCNFIVSSDGNRFLGPGVADDGTTAVQIAGAASFGGTVTGAAGSKFGGSIYNVSFDVSGGDTFIYMNATDGDGGTARFRREWNGNPGTVYLEKTDGTPYGFSCGAFKCTSFDAGGGDIFSDSDKCKLGYTGGNGLPGVQFAGSAFNFDASITRSGPASLAATQGNGSGLSDFAARTFSATITDSATNTITPAYTIDHETSGTPAAGFGVSQVFKLQSSTTASRRAGEINIQFAVATDATRQAEMFIGLYDYTDTFKYGLVLLDMGGGFGVYVATRNGVVLDDGAGNVTVPGKIGMSDSGTTPTNTITPVGWLRFSVGGTDSFIPYYQ